MADSEGAMDAGAGAEEVRVNIEGLSERMCGVLQGIKVGDVVEVAVFTKVDREDSADGDGTERESEDEVSDDGEGSDEDDESDLSGDAAAEDDTPNTTPPNESTTKQQQDAEVAAAMARSQDAVHAEQVGDAAILADFFANPVPGPSGTGPNANNQQLAPEDDTELAPIIASPHHDQEDELDDEAEDEHVSDEDEGEGEPGEDNEGSDEEEEEEAPIPQLSRDLYVVLGVMRDDEDDGSLVTDVHLRKLTYQDRGEEANFDTYRIFGSTISPHDESATLADGEEAESLVEMTTSQPENTFNLLLNPDGDRIRNTIFGRRCPANCARGWLPDQEALQALVNDELEQLRPYRPLCPVCLGRDLMNEQIMLRGILDNMGMVDIGLVVEFIGRLNPPRRLLGYRFHQFDEREWGYGFDDMLDEDGSEGDGEGGNGQFEHWDEAMDPNANPKTRPASDDTVAALPRKIYADVTKKEDGAFCAICQEGTFEEESGIVELPCGHVYDDDCLVAWIKQFDNCPECRATVSGMVESKAEHGVVDGAVTQQTVDAAEDPSAFADALPAITLAEDDKGFDVLEPEMDGEDTVMSDVD